MKYTIIPVKNGFIDLKIKNITLNEAQLLIEYTERNCKSVIDKKVLDVLKDTLLLKHTINDNEKIQAIKKYKELTGDGLIESKSYVERLLERKNITVL